MDTVDLVLAWTLAAVAVVLLAHNVPVLLGHPGLPLPGRLNRPVEPQRPRPSAAASVLVSVGLILLGLYITADSEWAILLTPFGATCLIGGTYWSGQLYKQSRRARPSPGTGPWPYQS